MLNDIRYAFRTLRNNRGLALTAIISIGLAIGANSAIFSFLDALVLRPLPVPEASKVLTLRSLEPRSNGSTIVDLNGMMSYPDYLDFRDRNQSFAGLTAFSFVP